MGLLEQTALSLEKSPAIKSARWIWEVTREDLRPPTDVAPTLTLNDSDHP